MPVRRIFSVAIACFAVLAGVGCSDRRGTPLPAETDEPYYVQGKQLIKQGRNPEALSYFLKVIDRRGERGAAESHLEAGFIYLHHTKDPVEAYHHFRKYLDLQPNSKEAAGVRGKVQDALREFARTLPARPLEDQSIKLEARETIERLRRENEELRAQNATLRAGAAAVVARPAPVIHLPPETLSAPAGPTSASAAATATSTPPAALPGPAAKGPSAVPRVNPAARTGPTSTLTHTVAPKETLYGISLKYYGHGRQVDALYRANRDVMKDPKDLRPQMTLKIPPAEAASAQPRR